MKNKIIPNYLKRIRRAAGYSQREVASILGVSYTTSICKWEKGLLMPGLRHVFIMANLFEVMPQELYVELWQTTKHSVKLFKEKNSNRYLNL